MHTLFTLEDLYGLTVSESDGEICLKVDIKGKDAYELRKCCMPGKSRLTSYLLKRSVKTNTMSGVTTTRSLILRKHGQVPSQALSDALVETSPRQTQTR